MNWNAIKTVIGKPILLDPHPIQDVLPRILLEAILLISAQ